MDIGKYTISCECCGSKSFQQVGENKFRCEFCGAETYLKHNYTDGEERLLSDAAILRRVHKHFNKAAAVYAAVLKINPDNVKALWGMFLTEYGIEYVQDYDKTYKPTFHCLSRQSVWQNKYYKRAVELSSGEEKEKYITDADDIEKIRVKMLKEAAKNKSYDVFLCYKRTKPGNGNILTPEALWAQDYWSELNRMGYNVFWAEKEIRGEYEPNIYNALTTAKFMIILCTDVEYLDSAWVINEWGRFLRRKKEDNAPIDFCVVYENIEPYDLPPGLKEKQALNHSKATCFEDLKKLIGASVGEAAKTDAEEARRKAEEQRRRAEAERLIREREAKLRAAPPPKTTAQIEAERKKKKRNTIIALSVLAAIIVVIVSSVIGVNASNANRAKKIEAENLRRAHEVAALINNIGNVTIESKSAIEAAQAAYNQLTSVQKSKVSNYAALTEADFNFGIIYAVYLIDEIGEVTYQSGAKVTAAENWYNKLTAAQKQQVLNYASLIQKKSDYNVANAVYLIDIIGTVSAESKAAVENAESAYNKLSTEQKTEITNYAVLTSARYNFDIIYTIYLINSIGTVTVNSEGDITAAQNYYDKLSSAQKAKITNYNVLQSALTAYSDAVFKSKVTLGTINGRYGVTAVAKDIKGVIEIPSKFDGKTIEVIGENAFKDCTQLSGIVLPNTVTIIGNSAFQNCTSLISAKLPSGLTLIPNNLFDGCTKLTTVNFPSGLQAIGNHAFLNCTSLPSVNFPSGLQAIGNFAFQGCALTSVTISAAIQSLGDYSFYNCAKLTQINYNADGVGGWHVFNNSGKEAGGITVNIGKNVTNIGYGVFGGDDTSNSPKIVSVVFESGSTCSEIAHQAFENCTSLTSITLPDSINNIGQMAFYGCSSLISLTIPEGVLSISNSAFAYCAGLTLYCYFDSDGCIRGSGWQIYLGPLWSIGTVVKYWGQW